MSDFTRSELAKINSALACLSNAQETQARDALEYGRKPQYEALVKAAYETRALGCKVEELITSAPRERYGAVYETTGDQ